MKKDFLSFLFLTIGLTTFLFAQDRPNIVVFWGDDVGMWNIMACLSSVLLKVN